MSKRAFDAVLAALTLIGIGIGSVKFVYSTFATEKRVDSIEATISEDRREFKEALIRIDSRVHDLWKRKKD